MKILNFKHLLLLVATVLTFSGCESLLGPKDIKSNGPAFDMDLFEANINAALDGNTVGYAYSIGLNGQAAREGAGGSAILANTHPDFPAQLDMSPYRRMQIASISKPITAIALFKAMDQTTLDIDLESPMYLYLPQHWNFPNSVKTITIKQLLEHTSGIVDGGNSYGDQKNLIEAGVLAANKGKYKYNNANFSLFRLIIPYLINPTLFSQTVMIGNDALIDQATVRLFKDFVEKEVTEPANITHNIWTAHSTQPVLFYDYTDLTKTAWLTPGYEESAGAYGYYLSANDISSIFAHARHQNGYLPQPYYDWFFKDAIGWFSSEQEHGKQLVHNGAWYSNGRGYHGVVYAFPNNVEATVLVNCHQNPESDNIQGIVNTAYQNAWVTP